MNPTQVSIRRAHRRCRLSAPEGVVAVAPAGGFARSEVSQDQPAQRRLSSAFRVVDAGQPALAPHTPVVHVGIAPVALIMAARVSGPQFMTS